MAAFFKWQGNYGAFTIAKSQVPRVRKYILNQEQHHRGGRLSPPLEQTSEDTESTKVDCVPL